MNSITARIRLQSLIQKDTEMLNGYWLALGNATNFNKAKGWIGTRRKIEGSRERKKQALQHINNNPNSNFSWEALCSQFKIRPYKQ